MGRLEVEGAQLSAEDVLLTCKTQVNYVSHMRKSAKRPASSTDRRSGCPISLSLEIFGDRWSLLIVRDLMFKGRKRFADFAAAEEHIASNVLTDRLGRLECAGIVTRTPDPADARKIVYRLTRKGMELAPMLIEMVLWAARYAETDAPRAQVRAMTADRDVFLAALWKTWEAEAKSCETIDAREDGSRSKPGQGRNSP
jgi:DNA-binding HxlR family transcriptional regulator